MKRKLVIEIESESYMEEQFLLDRFPHAVWVNLGGKTIFYLPVEDKEESLKAMKEWEEFNV